MADASSVRKVSSFQLPTGNTASSIRYNNNRLWFANGNTWTPLGADTEFGNNTKVVYTIASAVGATTTVYTVTSPCRLVAASYVHSVKGSNGSAVTLQLTKDIPGDSAGAGTSLLSTAFNCKGDNYVPQTGTLASATATATNPNGIIYLTPGDIITAKVTGTTTALANVALTLTFAPAIPVGGIVTVACSTVPVTSVNQGFFVADRAYKVLATSIKYGTAGTTLNATFEKCSGTTAAGSGTALNSAAIDCSATAGVAYYGTLSTTASELLIAAGDRIGIKMAGATPGSYATPVATVLLQPV
ncbi:hypothetical protein CCP3SC5AM1_880009 [Gammaproteobacteria bacterium]